MMFLHFCMKCFLSQKLNVYFRSVLQRFFRVALPFIGKMKSVDFALCLAILLPISFEKGNCRSNCDHNITLLSNASSVMCEQQSDLEMIEFMEDVLRSIAGTQVS